MVGLFLCHRLMAGNTKFLGVNLLCDRKRKAIPIGIALLFVRRRWIVNLCLHTVVDEIFLQFVASLTHKREDMPHTITTHGTSPGELQQTE